MDMEEINNNTESPKVQITRTQCSLYRTILPLLSLIGAGVFVVLGVRKKLPLQKAAIGAKTCAVTAVVSRVLAYHL